MYHFSILDYSSDYRQVYLITVELDGVLKQRNVISANVIPRSFRNTVPSKFTTRCTVLHHHDKRKSFNQRVT